MLEGAGVFLGLWVRKPLQIAAICPSGEDVGKAMASLVDLARPGIVLELGAGTGSLTGGLLRAGCPPERLVAVEREPRLVAILRRRCRGVAAIAGDAVELDAVLREHRIDRLAAVVSSLPIKWFPLAAQRAVTSACFARLGPNGCFLQLTNAFSSPLAHQALGLAGRQALKVWRNVPPAQIWRYTRPASSDAGRMP